MQLRKLALRDDINPPPPDDKRAWTPIGYGRYVLSESIGIAPSQEKYNQELAEARKHIPNLLSEHDVEMQCFLNVLAALGDRKHITFMELGAGRGDWSLMLDVVVNRELLADCGIESFYILALESEPRHYYWCNQHLSAQIKCYRHGLVPMLPGPQKNREWGLWPGAVWWQRGWVNFTADLDPRLNYGGCVSPNGNLKVRAYTLEDLVHEHTHVGRADFIHMDVQGAEAEIFENSVDFLNTWAIDYLQIGCHYPEGNERLVKAVEKWYNVILDIPCFAGLVQTPWGPAKMDNVDGILLLERKGQ